MSKTIKIEPENAGARLDLFLTGLYPDISRSKLQAAIKDGRILLNGKPAKPHTFLKTDDEIAMPAEKTVAPPAATKLQGRQDIPFAVIYEDDKLAVIDKPTGLLVHPTVQGETETLAHALVGRWPGLAKVGEAPERPGIVHRLDKEASGLLVVAKTKKAFAALKAQFQEHSIEKEYAVLVNGRPPKEADTISLTIGRSAAGNRMAARAEALDENDRPAITHYRVEEYFNGATLLSVRTETGRTHQIRAHLHALGSSVAGDPLYHIKRGPVVASPRLFLHCRRLAFKHPKTGQRVEFTSPLPADLESTLKKLRN